MAKREVCNKCLRPLKVCYCRSINLFRPNSKILILRDHKEKLHPFNTARIAELSLDSCTVLDTDSKDFSPKLEEFINEYSPCLIFKKEDSKPLEENLSKLDSKNFILLDGTWSKAKKILFTNPSLQSLTTYHLNPRHQTVYKSLRKACGEEFVSTFEAVLETLELIDDLTEEQREKVITPLKYVVKQQEEIKKGPNK